MTIPVVAIFTVKEGAEAKVEHMFRAVIDTTLAEEGCISYQLNRDTENASRFIWTEEWESRELLQKHLDAPHITTLFAEIPQYIVQSEVIALNKIAGGKA